MLRALVWFLGVIFAESVLAHSLGESYGVLRVDPEARSYSITYNMRRDQFLQLADMGNFAGQPPLDVVASVVRSSYQLSTAGVACEKSRFAAMETKAFLQAGFVALCPGAALVELSNDAFFQLLPDHLHFVRVSTMEGTFLGERVLDRATRTWALPGAGPTQPTDVLLRYGRLGIDHLVLGLDHLAFLGSILLLVRGVKPLLYAVTGFTVGHSISLALAVLGLAVADGPLVEALIGLTITLVAAESVYRRHSRIGTYTAVVGVVGSALLMFAVLHAGPSPVTLGGVTLFFCCYLLLTRERPDWVALFTPLVTLFFGLIHGFGFAGSLLAIGLPREQLAAALLAFNIGIELGQLMVIGTILVLLAVSARCVPGLRRINIPGQDLLAGALVTLGTFWFVDRAFI